MDQLRAAILKTIRYGGQFGADYGYEEIRERLISARKYPDEEINSKLREMNTVNINSMNSDLVTEKISKAENLGKLLAERFPNILMVGVTGSVAAGTPKENEDIDLMMIVKKDSLWITRLTVMIWIWVNRIPHRKYRLKQKKDDFCFNLWLEEESLKLPNSRKNLKNAMDLILMKPVVSKDNIYERFVRKNEWVKKYVANGYNKIINNFRKNNINKKPSSSQFGKIINLLMFWLQYVYMKNKFNGETVDQKRAFFHPRYRK